MDALSGPVTKVGKYEVLEQVGEGAMGVVYRAKDPILNRTVAIKVMSEGLANDEALRERFLREAQAAGSLQHPNVVTIFDFGETEGHLFIAMEFIQGADLEHLLQHNAPLSLAAKLDIMIDVLNGLGYAHKRGIIHRDIKPANIRVDDEGHARIMDFGVARLSTSNMTKTGVMMGTPNYMAPEQVTGEALTAAVDLFSAGAVLYELLTNTKPFAGDTMHSVLYKIVSEPPPDLGELKPDLPPALNGIVRKALAKDPAERYRTAAEMANAVTAVRAPLGPTRLSKTISHRISIDKALKEKQAAQHGGGSRKTVVALGAGGAVLAAATIMFALKLEISPREPVLPSGAGASVGAPSPAPAIPSPPAPASSVALAGASIDSQATKQPAVTPTAQRRATPIEPQPRPAARDARSAEARTPAIDSTVRRARADENTRTAPSNPPAQEPPAPPATANPQTLAASSPTPPVTAPSTQVTSPANVTASPASPAAPATAEPVNHRPAIAAVIAEYARAIGTRDIAEIRRTYPGMTSAQQAAWQSFFGSIRSISASFEISALDITGTTAVARLTGMYDYFSRTGREARQPVAVEATLLREGDRWTLRAVK
jgi:serine/threonine protein kinase